MEEHHAKGLESKVGDYEVPKGIGKDRSHSTEHQTGQQVSHRRVRIVSASEITTNNRCKQREANDYQMASDANLRKIDMKQLSQFRVLQQSATIAIAMVAVALLVVDRTVQLAKSSERASVKRIQPLPDSETTGDRCIHAEKARIHHGPDWEVASWDKLDKERRQCVYGTQSGWLRRRTN